MIRTGPKGSVLISITFMVSEFLLILLYYEQTIFLINNYTLFYFSGTGFILLLFLSICLY